MRTKFKHKFHKKLYLRWVRMRQRCNNPKCSDYQFYGERGISICPSWNTFQTFCEDMGEPPSFKYTIERIDVNGNYCKENCRWATRTEQARNCRSNRLVTYQGREMCLEEAAKIIGIPRRTLQSRIVRLGWPVEKALNTPRLWKSYDR